MDGHDNIFYEISDTDGDYEFVIKDGVVIQGRRSNKAQARDANTPDFYRGPLPDFTVILNPYEPDTVQYGPGPGDDGTGQNAPQDDHGRRGYAPSGALHDPKMPVMGNPPGTRYGGIFIDTGVEFNGNIKLESRANITVDNEPFSTSDAALQGERREGLNAIANARGISVHHYGRSGDLDLDIGGIIRSVGAGIHATIDSRFGGENEEGEFKDLDFDGDININLAPGATISTTGHRGHGIEAAHRGRGTIRVTAEGTPGSDKPTIETTGNDAGGINVEMGNTWEYDATARGDVEVNLENVFIRTSGIGDFRGVYGSGVKVYNNIRGDVDVDVTGSTIETQAQRGIFVWHQDHGKLDIDVTDSTITAGDAQDGHFHAIIGQRNWDGPVMINVEGSTLTTQSHNSHGIYGRHRGPSGDVHITARDSTILTQGDHSHGIYAHHNKASGLGQSYVEVDGGSIEARAGTGILAGFDHPAILGHAEVTIKNGARVQGSNAIEFQNGRGTLNLIDGSVVGNIQFAEGDYDDALTIRQTRTSRKLIAKDIHFGDNDDDDDKMTIDTAAGQHLDFGTIGEGMSITGLETLTKKGGGIVRFAGDVGLNDSMLHLNDGVLVLAGQLDLAGSTLNIKNTGKLVFEVGTDHQSAQIFDGTLHFADGQEPVVLVQLNKDLADNQIAEVRGRVDGLPVLYYTKATKGTESVDDHLVLHSKPDGDADEGRVGTVDLVTGWIVLDGEKDDNDEKVIAGKIGKLVLPGELTTSSGTTDTTPSPSPSTPVVSDPPPVEPTPTEPSSPDPEDGTDPESDKGSTDATNGDTDDGTDGSEMPSDAAPENDSSPTDPTPDSNTPGTDAPTATASSGGSGGGGIIGLGLLAVLLASFSADDEASAASLADAAFSSPQSAYIAEANERGTLTLRETGNKPYRMWIRTSQGTRALPMTGVAKAGVDGAEVGFNLYGSDRFYLGASVAPNVTAQVDSLNLAAEGTVYALSSGWRNDHAFAGLRLSQGTYEVDSVVANPMVNGALFSQAQLRNTQVQLRTGLNLNAGALRFTPSASIQTGRFAQGAHVAESAVLRADVPAFTQDYTSYQLGLKMSSDQWLNFDGGRWQPQMRFDTIRTHAGGVDALSLRQSDKAGALSFDTQAGIRNLPEVVNAFSLGAKVKVSGNDQALWKFGFAGFEADGETNHVALATYQLRF